MLHQAEPVIKVMVVDDHQIIRQGLRSLINGEEDLQFVGEAEDGRTAMKLIPQLLPQVIVMDLRMPDLNGVEASRQVKALLPHIKIVGLSADSSHALISELFRVGASGFVLKTSAFEELTTAIRAVMKGHVYISPAVAGMLVDSAVNGGLAQSSPFSSLSARERGILQLISEGHATKQIAQLLNVSVKTAETHRRNLMMKLNLDNVADLTKFAIREGITCA